MKLKRIALSWLVGLTLTACVIQEPGVYRGGKLIKDEPLDIKEFNSFRFANKWRISHRWLTGPTNIWPCEYGGNGFANRPGWEALGQERNSPMFEVNGELIEVDRHYKTDEFLLNRVARENIHGTTPDGRFQGYTPFCGHVFKDSLDGIGLYILKPDPAKGTDEWIQNATVVTINGLQWLYKNTPIQDWSDSKVRLNAPIEHWVLKIPDTPYWLLLRFSASSGGRHGLGAGSYPQKHQQLLSLFHKIVHSVTLEPITPVDITPLLQGKQ